MFLSIIVPVFNAQKYIDECLLSCLHQDVDVNDYQIVCVNDGSKDKSLDILNSYAERFSNVIVINQENKGVSVARNNALKISKGEYVWFVDSDDFIRSNCLNELKNLAREDYDIISFGGYEFDLELNDMERELLANNQLEANRNYWGYSTFKLYKKSLIDSYDIQFNSEIKYGEDELFVNDINEHAEKIYKLERTNYFYRKNPNSAMNSLSIPENQIKQLESVIISMFILKKGIENKKYTKDSSLNLLKSRYKGIQNCFKKLDFRLANKYLKIMKNYELFNYEAIEANKACFPCEIEFIRTYLKQHSVICLKSFIKKVLPESIIQKIKKVLRIPEE